MLGIEQARPGNRLGDIGHAIQRHAEEHRYGVVRDFCGHGLGRLFHDAPEVVHAGRPGTGPELRPGMFFTIEPMINIGRADVQGARRRLDGGDPRPLALGAVRAFDRHHRGWLRDFHQEPRRARQAALLLMATEHLTRAELGRALGLEAGDVPLPVTARSLTRKRDSRA